MEAEEVVQKKEEIKSKVGNKKANNVFSTLKQHKIIRR